MAIEWEEKRRKKRVGITRAKADELVRDLVQRAQEVNQSPDYLYGVTRIEVFGSYLTDVSHLGDIDLAVTLEPKCSGAEWKRREERERKQAPPSYRRDFYKLLYWPYERVLRALRARHSAFSFHSPSDLESLKMEKLARSRVLFRG